MKKTIPAILLIVALLFGQVVSVSASTDWTAPFIESVSYISVGADENTRIYPQNDKDGNCALFLPSSAELESLTLYFPAEYTSVVFSAGENSITVKNAEAFDLTSLFPGGVPEDDRYSVTVFSQTALGDTKEDSLYFMKSSGLRAMYLVSDDPEYHGREWVEIVKTNETTGKMSFVGTDGEVAFSQELTSLKGRGNATFDYAKKPYQIKLDKKVDLIGGEKSEANKKWVLLANFMDVTLIHNEITFALAKQLGLPYTPNYESIDLYYDGEYRGTYTLTEKTEVGSSRIDISNTDDLIEEANSENPAYENINVLTATTASGGTASAKANSAGSYRYVEGLNEPELPDGASHQAYLLELDFTVRYAAEVSGFVTSRGQAVTSSCPEFLTQQTGEYISRFFNEFEKAVYSADGLNTDTGKYYYDYCDLDSLVNIYLIHELAKNIDAFRSSSYFYMPEDEDILYAGPVWDFDMCYGVGGINPNSRIACRQTSADDENFFASTKYMLSALVKIESFRDAVKEKLTPGTGIFYNAVEALKGESGYIRSLAGLVSQSQKLNYSLWNIENPAITALNCMDECTYENTIDFLETFVSERTAWLSKTTALWSGENYSMVFDSEVLPRSPRYHTAFHAIDGIAATCTQDGLSIGYVCDDCNEVIQAQSVIKSKGHKWKAATCTAPETCTVCGETRAAALGHDYVLNTALSTDEYLYYKCSRCTSAIKMRTGVVTVIPGDLDGDGKVKANDARIALRIAAGLQTASAEQLKAADFNGDGIIKPAECRKILRIAAGLE